jgi:hypothetical protein
MSELHNGLIKVAGSSFGINSKPVPQIPFWRSPLYLFQNIETKMKHVAVDNGNRLSGKEAIAAAVYSPTPFNFNRSL